MPKKIRLAGHLVLFLGSIVLGQTAYSFARKIDEFGDIQVFESEKRHAFNWADAWLLLTLIIVLGIFFVGSTAQ